MRNNWADRDEGIDGKLPQTIYFPLSRWQQLGLSQDPALWAGEWQSTGPIHESRMISMAKVCREQSENHTNRRQEWAAHCSTETSSLCASEQSKNHTNRKQEWAAHCSTETLSLCEARTGLWWKLLEIRMHTQPAIHWACTTMQVYAQDSSLRPTHTGSAFRCEESRCQTRSK